MNTVLYTESAKKDLEKLEKMIAKRIVLIIQKFASQKNPLLYAKKIRNTNLGEYRFRIGHYRALFDIDDNGKIYILMILKIKHRKDVYEL